MSSPQVPGDLKAMGFDLVSHANNHATDWGVAGLLETDRRLDKAGLVHAGSGASLTAARAPAYYDAKAGRVALIAMAAHFTEMEPAQDGAGDVHARPGINPLHYEMFVLPCRQSSFQQLAAIRDMQAEGSYTKDKKEDVVTLFGTKYKKQIENKGALGLHYTVNPEDEKAILRSVRQGKEVADFVIVSAHVHEPGNLQRDAAGLSSLGGARRHRYRRRCVHRPWPAPAARGSRSIRASRSSTRWETSST